MLSFISLKILACNIVGQGPETEPEPLEPYQNFRLETSRIKIRRLRNTGYTHKGNIKPERVPCILQYTVYQLLFANGSQVVPLLDNF
jgi:hypothetical protein